MTTLQEILKILTDNGIEPNEANVNLMKQMLKLNFCLNILQTTAQKILSWVIN